MRKTAILAVICLFITGAVFNSSFVGCMKENMVVLPEIDAQVPNKTETATFALGWFWGPDSRFGSIDGVVRTRVGYAGGSSANPTYYNLDSHSETIQLDYEPDKVTYTQLLEVFWDSHNPTVQPWSRQYMSILFYHNDEQKQLAISSKEHEETRLGKSIFTEITSFSGFYRAEDYHQKYYLLQKQSIAKEFRAIYPDIHDFTDSTAVARVNGYIGGYGRLTTLEEELSSFGLSESGRNKLLEIANNGLIPGCPLPGQT